MVVASLFFNAEAHPTQKLAQPTNPIASGQSSRLTSNASFAIGLNYFNKQDYLKALEALKTSAEQGNSDAQYLLGIMYLEAIGLPQNNALAMTWLEESAMRGNTSAQLMLGLLLHKKNPKSTKALFWISEAAQFSNPIAQFAMGDIYRFGLLGKTPNRYTAFDWYKKAAQHIPEAMYNVALYEIQIYGLPFNSNIFELLGKAHNLGHERSLALQSATKVLRNQTFEYESVLEQNNISVGLSKTKDWFLTSIANKYSIEQNSIGLMHENGSILIKNLKLAKEWYGIACDNGLQEGCDNYRKLNEMGI